MKKVIMFLLFLGVFSLKAQIQTGVWRSPLNNTEYNQFVRNGVGAALLVNQVSANNSILALSSETAAPGENIRFIVLNDGSMAIGKASVTASPDYRMIDIQGKSNTAGGMLRLSTLDGSGVARMYANTDLVFKTDKESMKFRWVNSSNKEVYSVESTGIARWKGNASSYTEVASNANGQYIRQYDNDGGTQAWLIRGYASNGVQAIFNKGGIDVNGTIRSREVKVESNTAWPDYVFEDNYRLPDLTDLESYIKTHRHLPNMPNQKQVETDGISLGEMNRKLLEKVEELTLLLIEKEKAERVQNKKIEMQEARILHLEQLNHVQKND